MIHLILDYLEIDVLQPVRHCLESIEINNSTTANLLCKIIPSHCPFERDIKIFGRTLLHVPSICKLNPLYEQVIGLRFKALCYLVEMNVEKT